MSDALAAIWLVPLGLLYWIGYRFRSFIALAILALIFSAPLLVVFIASLIEGPQESGSWDAILAVSVVITILVEALPVALLIRREARRA
jgi:membrane protein DedA with SNARE-associated domain